MIYSAKRLDPSRLQHAHTGIKIIIWFMLFTTCHLLAQNDQSVTIAGQTYTRAEGKWFSTQNGNLLDELILDTLIIGKSGRLPVTQAEVTKYGVSLKAQLQPGYAVVKVNTAWDPFAILSALINDQYDASFDTRITFLNQPALATPYDTYYSASGSYTGQWPLKRVGMPAAWDLTKGNPAIVVAVSDSGVQYTHPDLIGNLWTNAREIANNGIDDDYNGKVDDRIGWDFADNDNDPDPLINQGTEANPHGTNTAGVIAARTNNGIGVAGVAGGWYQTRGVSYMPMRIDDTLSAGMASVLYAVQTGAHVVNMSWGTTTYHNSLADLFTYLDLNYDSVLVAAAGNDESQPVLYPAAFPSTIAVGSSNHLDLYAGDSYGRQLDLVAPKASVTTDVLGLPGTDPEDLQGHWNAVYGVFSLDYHPLYGGTSACAPLVSGGAALMLSLNAGLSPAQVRKALLDTAEKIGPYDYNWNASIPGHSPEMGYGLLRVDLALSLSHQWDTLDLQLPAAGAHFPSGAAVPITWNRKGYTGPVDVKLYDSRGFVQTLATALTTSSLTWTNPGTLVSDRDFRIKVAASGQALLYDFSDRPFGLEGIAQIRFPDSNLLRALIQLGFDLNADQRIDVIEAASIVNLDLSQQEIADLAGLEWFPNLATLDCSHNLITDMSPVLANHDFMARCDKSIDFSHNLLDVNSPTGVCELACSPWLSFQAGYQRAAFNCLCWDPPCEDE